MLKTLYKYNISMALSNTVMFPLLIHWGRVTHICANKLTIIGSYKSLSYVWRQAIILANAGILLVDPVGTNFSEVFFLIHTLAFRKMHFKMLCGKWRAFCLGINVLTHCGYYCLFTQSSICAYVYKRHNRGSRYNHAKAPTTAILGKLGHCF